MFSLASLFLSIFIQSFSAQTFAAETAKIITLTPALAEWTYEVLGKERALKDVVGVSEYSDYPVALKSIDRIGPYPQIDIEKIAALKPTQVIASSESNRADQLEKLKRLKLRVEVLPAEKFSTMGSWIKKLGDVLGEKKGAEAAAVRWTQSVSELRKNRPSKSIMIEVQDTPLIVVGGDSFLNEAFSAVGYENIFADLKQAYPKVSREAILEKNPEIVFIIDLTGNGEDFEKSKAAWQKFTSLKAVKNQQLRIIAGDDFARCSPRLLNALKQLH